MAFQILRLRDNDALETNPPAGDAHITTHASDWLWAVFALMLVSWLASLAWTGMSRRRNRTLHCIPVIVLAVATIAYFSMASDLGWTLVRSEFDDHPTRQIFYVRYIQWFINAPLLLLSLLAFTGMSTADILTTLFFSWYLVVSGLVGALVPSSYKWGYFVFGLFGLFFIWSRLLVHANFFPFRSASFRAGYIIGSAFISFIWMLYPICWGLSEGSNTISPTSEMVFYGILDLLSGPVFLLSFIAHLSRFDFDALAPTALGAADRGVDGGAAPQKVRPAAPGQQQPAPLTSNAPVAQAV